MSKLRGLTTSAAHVRSIIPRGTTRQRQGLHITPAVATRGLLSVEGIEGPVWEPACGRGAISMVLETAGLKVVSTDLADHGHGLGGVNFLFYQPRFKFNSIVTNPPFGRLNPLFARRAATFRVRFYLIGRLLWFEGGEKEELFRECGLRRIWSFSRRVNISPVRYKRVRADGLGGMIAYAWYVFEPGNKRWPPTIDYIDIDSVLKEN